MIVQIRTLRPEVARSDDGLWRISAQSDDGTTTTLVARFLIDASGRSATVARSARRPARDGRPPRGRSLLIVRLRSRLPEKTQGVTLVESVPEGWWYSTWLPDNILAVAFMTDADLVRPLEAQNVEGWTRLLARASHTRMRVVGGSRPTRQVTRTAASHLLRPAGGPGWLATGDALSAFDPLSSMGIGHALISGASAARAVEAIMRRRRRPTEEYSQAPPDISQSFSNCVSRYYQMEQRWPHLPFWSRRHGSPRV